MKYCEVYHFAENANLLYFNISVKKINKQGGFDLKYLSYWLNANKICLNVSKTIVTGNSLETCTWLLFMLLQDFFTSARLHRVHKRFCYRKVQYIICAT